ncbi:hypothetical protein [Flavobacterium sp.]|uniref:hypothetical protein n=1 Tax=Flavobacterium sp. TaxID=239 RepID=UPI002B4B6FA2|nr:hypothetical protein [Flavobacterium sp.]HLP64620.1 hypothetical protein [Flavobacterium sp.]
MKNSIITVPKPCSENWSAMTVVEQGRFCQSCQKKVYDFTQSSDREIAKAFQMNNSLCGRFANTQLNRELIVPKEKSSIWLATTSAVISFLGLGTDDLVAQEKTPTIQTEKIENTKNAVTNEIVALSGIVVDENDTPLSGIVIKFNGNETVHTRYDGTFSLKVNRGTTVLFSDDFDYEISTHIVKAENKNLKIVCPTKILVQQRIILGMVTYVDTETYTQPSEKRSFFGRIFYAIGNLFR